jgi:hypothetical protein
MVAVVTAMETAAAGAPMTAAGAPTTAPGVGADGITFANAVGAETTAVGTAKSAASAARTAWCFWRGVAHIGQYLPPCWRRCMHHINIPNWKQRRRRP